MSDIWSYNNSLFKTFMQGCLKWCLVPKLAASYLQLANRYITNVLLFVFLKLRIGASFISEWTNEAGGLWVCPLNCFVKNVYWVFVDFSAVAPYWRLQATPTGCDAIVHHDLIRTVDQYLQGEWQVESGFTCQRTDFLTRALFRCVIKNLGQTNWLYFTLSSLQCKYADVCK